MKPLKIHSLITIIILLLSPLTVNASVHGDQSDDANGNSSSVFDSYLDSAETLDSSLNIDAAPLEFGDDYTELLAAYVTASERDHVDAILGNYPVARNEFIREISDWDNAAVINRMQNEIDEEIILGILIARSPKIRMAEANWLASMERYPQTVFLQDILAGYHALSEGMALGIGKEYQRDMVSMHYPGQGMLELRGRVVELDIEMAWQDLLKTSNDVIADAKILMAEIRHKDEMISINSSSVSRLSVLTSVVQAQYISGSRSFADLVRIRTELASRQDTLNRVRSMRDSLTGQLASMLDLSPTTAFGEFSWSDDSLMEIDTNSHLASLAGSNPELIKMAHGVEKMDAMLAMTLLRADPDTTFGFTYYQGRDVEALDSGMPEMSGMTGPGMDMNFMNEPMLDYRNSNFSLDLTWAAELASRRDSMNEMLIAKTDMLSGMLNMQVEKYQRSIDSRGVSRGRIIPNANSALSVIRTGYTADENNFNDLIMAELSLLMARMDLADYDRDMRIALSDVERIVGHGISDGVSE